MKWGSSPLARGLPRPVEDRDAVDRIIPARAGFTPSAAAEQATAGDHPRSRGVYGVPDRPRRYFDGSSPLARGLQSDFCVTPVPPGIIPARAGFTRTVLATVRIVPDHPRSRGVYSFACFSLLSIGGSSPLARGLLLMPRQIADGIRIIPARAGFTHGSCPLIALMSDHPRSRGVYT